MYRKQAPTPRRPRLWPPVRSLTSALIVIALCVGGDAVSALAGLARHDVVADTAHTTSVRENVHATNVSHQGNTLINDRGRGTGTFNCPVVMQVRVSYTKGDARIICTTSSGNVLAAGTVSFFTAGQTATFTGKIGIQHGTGKYSHASGQVSVEGTMQRKTYVLEAIVSGSISY